MDLGSRLRDARKAKKLTQTECGQLGGVGKFAQIRFEQGVNIPGGEYWLGLFAAGFDVAYILTGAAGALDAVESEVLLRYRAASQDMKGAVLRILDVPASASSPPAVSVTGGEHGQVVVGPVKQRDVTFNVGGKKRGMPK